VPGPETHVDWAEKHGRLRAKPLRPSDDPLHSLDWLVATLDPKSVGVATLNEISALRCQAWRTVAIAAKRPLSQDMNARDFYPRKGYDPGADWAARRKLIADLKVRWDDARQEYVAGN